MKKKIQKVKNIIESKITDSKDLPDWYEMRVLKCKTCDFNSNNVENKSIKTKLWGTIAGAHCIDCGCTIKDKCKIKTEDCPQLKWVNMNKTENNKLVLGCKSTLLDDFSFNNEVYFYEADYGVIKYNTDSKIDILIKENKYTNFTVKSECGCTVPKKTDQTLSVTYDTRRTGAFNKKVTIVYYHGTERYQTIIKLKGVVKK